MMSSMTVHKATSEEPISRRQKSRPSQRSASFRAAELGIFFMTTAMMGIARM
jgi:hypothetical protein